MTYKTSKPLPDIYIQKAVYYSETYRVAAPVQKVKNVCLITIARYDVLYWVTYKGKSAKSYKSYPRTQWANHTYVFPAHHTYDFPQFFLCQYLVHNSFEFVWPESEFVRHLGGRGNIYPPVYGCNETIILYICAYSLQFNNSTAVNVKKSVSYIVHSFREKHKAY